MESGEQTPAADGGGRGAQSKRNRDSNRKGKDTAKQKQPPYARLPLDAAADCRLHRTHLAVLIAVSYRDRGGKNGSGCYETKERLAEMAACRRETVSRALRDLVAMGYLTAEKVAGRKRLQYRVQMDPEQRSQGVIHESQNEDANCDPAVTEDGSKCDPWDTENPLKCDPRGHTNTIGNNDSAEAAVHTGPTGLPAQGTLSREAAASSAAAEYDPAEAAAAHPRKPRPPEALVSPARERGDPLEITEANLWAYRRRWSQALKDGHIPTDEQIDEIAAALETAADMDEESETKAYEALEDLLRAAEEAQGDIPW